LQDAAAHVINRNKAKMRQWQNSEEYDASIFKNASHCIRNENIYKLHKNLSSWKIQK
jgi:hypothetical protein